MPNRSRENSLWAWLRPGLPRDSQATRIENCVERGTPDVELHAYACQAWLELKSVPRREHVFCELSPDQARWLKRRSELGGVARVLVQVGVGHDARRYLIDGLDCYELLKSLSESRLEELSRCHPILSTPEHVVMMIVAR